MYIYAFTYIHIYIYIYIQISTFRNFLICPPLFLSGISFEPLHDSSSMDPYAVSFAPEIVPVPRRSPGRIGHPVTA